MRLCTSIIYKMQWDAIRKLTFNNKRSTSSHPPITIALNILPSSTPHPIHSANQPKMCQTTNLHTLYRSCSHRALTSTSLKPCSAPSTKSCSSKSMTFSRSKTTNGTCSSCTTLRPSAGMQMEWFDPFCVVVPSSSSAVKVGGKGKAEKEGKRESGKESKVEGFDHVLAGWW